MQGVPHRVTRSSRTAATILLLSSLTFGGQADERRPYTTWSEYGGSPDSMQYSALDQINRSNVRQLAPAWFYAVGGEADRLPFNPLVIGDAMYIAGPKGVVVALDAATGKELWTSTERATERGLAYWESQDRSDRRVIVTSRSGIREINAKNGELIRSFGRNGTVDMRTGTDRRLAGPPNSPGRVFENLLIIGSNPGEGYGSPPGDLRAYNTITGALVWTFHTIPRPGEFGYDTWPPDAWKYAGGANTWGDITLDAKNGIVFFPTGSPTHDLYGADRVGSNLFGNCLLALDARTGKRLWHFQTVHHDLWDYDLTASPKLLTIRDPSDASKTIDIVAQAGKTGFLYVFERRTGKPVWPIEERPVPKSEVPGEVSWPTQPIPSRPPPFARQTFKVEDVNPFLPADEQDRLRQAVRDAANEGVFTPSSHLRYHIQFPGAWGGANWGSTAADPASGMLYVRSLEMPSYRKMALEKPRPPTLPADSQAQRAYNIYMQQCASCHGPGQLPMRPPSKLGSDRFRALLRQGQDQMPAFPPTVLSNDNVNALETYLVSLPVADDPNGAESFVRLPQNPNRYSGPESRYAGSFSAGWYGSNGLPTVGPPWTQLVAYDLNEGVIKWRVADGNSPGLAEKGILSTGTVRPRNGPVVTAGGLVFLPNSQDRVLRAFDKDTGAVLWEHELQANPEGIPAIYEVRGRQYIAFAAGASWGTGSDPVWKNPFHRKQGKLEAQGYHVFALPARRDPGRVAGVGIRDDVEFHGRKAWTLENGHIRVSLLRQGGHIAEIRFLSGTPQLALNPMFIPTGAGYMGHMVCFPHFGPASADERQRGLAGHGEANAVEWRETKPARVGDRGATFFYGAELPKTNYRIERAVSLEAGTAVLRVEETIENLTAYDRPFNRDQHATFGAPFVAPGKHMLDMSGTKGMTDARRTAGDAWLARHEFRWPDAATAAGASVDLRSFRATPAAQVYTPVLADVSRPTSWFTVYNVDYPLLVGYVFPTGDHPWIIDWQNQPRGDATAGTARGIEFGTSPFDEGLRASVDRGQLFGVPTYRWIAAGQRLSTTFTIFLTEIAPGFAGVRDVRAQDGRIVISERGSARQLIVRTTAP
jgi:quinoprotein glucose dehydrogenase